MTVSVPSRSGRHGARRTARVALVLTGLAGAGAVCASTPVSAAGTSDVASAPQARAPETGTTVVGLSRGSQGPGVISVQNKLMSFGYVLSGGADGVFGASTDTALRHFQRSSGLNPTGVVTANTARYLGLSGAATSTRPPAASSSPATGSPMSAAGLRRGNTGPAVRQLQTAVLRTGLFLSGGVDGLFGASTEHAVKLVQRVNGLSETGVVDTATARALGLTANSPSAPSAPSPRSTPSTPATSTTGTAHSTSGYVGLTLGSVGPAVRELQEALLATGMTVRGGADGVFGQATYNALRGYQRVNGLGQTGVLDAATARLMGLGTSPTRADPPATTPSSQPPSSAAATAVAAAMTQRGAAYRYGRALPGFGFDCSGLTAWAWARAGVALPYQSGLQFATIPHVSTAAARPGDLVFFHSPISHVAMYLGNNRMIDAMQPGTGVVVRSVNWSAVVGVGRPG